MLKGTFPIDKFKALATPFYYYNIELLKETLNMVKTEAGKYGYHVHYAVKANANPRILSVIAEYGLGADCVSGGEIQAALDAGFPAGKIVYAGVGKADWEINLGLDNDIFCFNVESAAELEILDELAAAKNKVASIALRINPEVDAHTHAKITTGMKENKFGINLSQLGQVLDLVSRLEHVKLIGINCHIGSQITDMAAFRGLVIRVNEIQEELEARGIKIENLNFRRRPRHRLLSPESFAYPGIRQLFCRVQQTVAASSGTAGSFRAGTFHRRTMRFADLQSAVCKSRRDEEILHLRRRFHRADPPGHVRRIPPHGEYHQQRRS